VEKIRGERGKRTLFCKVYVGGVDIVVQEVGLELNGCRDDRERPYSSEEGAI